MAEKNDDVSARLQHPRRSLGNRHRSQAEKFLSLADAEPQNLDWAEQSARQAVLHDFTNPLNWRTLVRVKLKLGDESGIRAVLNELFTILGRDAEALSQLDGINMVQSGTAILEASLAADPLDADEWWTFTSGSEEEFDGFVERLGKLDLTDTRANVLFSIRLERVSVSCREDEYLELSRIILAQRPSNHEAWTELGRMHERRGEFDQAWMCYDQAQTHFPDIEVRDRFKDRMESKMDGLESQPWKEPGVSSRIDFLRRMQSLAMSDSGEVPDEEEVEEESVKDPLKQVRLLHAEGRLSEAFFLARSMAAEGVEGAFEMAEGIKGELG